MELLLISRITHRLSLDRIRNALAIKASTFSPYQPVSDTVVTDVEEALSLGADAVSLGVFDEVLEKAGLAVIMGRLVM